MRDDNCIFCKLAGGEIPTNAIYEDEDFKVILDMAPATKGHALILPKQHFKNIYECTGVNVATCIIAEIVRKLA